MWNVLMAEMRREFVQLRRYPTELFSEVAVLVCIFYGLFLGASYMAGTTAFGSRLSDIIVGYALWTLSMNSVGTMGWNIADEALNGTLEQVFLSPFGARRILLFRNVASVVVGITFTTVVLIIVMAITGHWLVLSPLDLIPALLMTIASAGLGFIVASVTILMKRANQLLNLLQFILLFLIMAPLGNLTGPWKVVGILAPFSPIVALLRGMTTGGIHLLGSDLFLWSVVNTAVWLFLGLWAFGVAERYARKQGTLSHY